MEVGEAITVAKNYVKKIFDEDGIKNLGLEEVQFDDSSNTWRITIGFSRPWDNVPSLPAGLDVAFGPPPLSRSYKMVRLSDADGRVLSVTSRDVSLPTL